MAKYSTLDVSKGSEYASYQWLHIRTLHKYLGRQDWGSWCFFLTSYSCCSRCTTELPWTCTQSDNIHCKATWLAELKHPVFLFLFSVGTWNILKVLRLMFCLCWNCYEWLLQFEPSTINIYIDSKSFGRQQPCLKCNFSGILEFLDTGRKSWTLDSGPWNLDPGLWTLDSGLWTLHSGLRTLDSGCWTLDCGR